MTGGSQLSASPSSSANTYVPPSAGLTYMFMNVNGVPIANTKLNPSVPNSSVTGSIGVVGVYTVQLQIVTSDGRTAYSGLCTTTVSTGSGPTPTTSDQIVFLHNDAAGSPIMETDGLVESYGAELLGVRQPSGEQSRSMFKSLVVPGQGGGCKRTALRWRTPVRPLDRSIHAA